MGISLVYTVGRHTGADHEHQAHLHSSPHCQGRGSTPPQTHHLLVRGQRALVSSPTDPFLVVCQELAPAVLLFTWT